MGSSAANNLSERFHSPPYLGSCWVGASVSSTIGSIIAALLYFPQIQHLKGSLFLGMVAGGILFSLPALMFGSLLVGQYLVEFLTKRIHHHRIFWFAVLGGAIGVTTLFLFCGTWLLVNGKFLQLGLATLRGNNFTFMLNPTLLAFTYPAIMGAVSAAYFNYYEANRDWTNSKRPAILGIMTPNPFRWVEIYVDDMERAKAFYQTVFKTELVRLENPEPEMWAFPMSQDIMGASGALVKIEGFSAGKNSVIPYFGCEECSVEQNRVEAAGGRIHKPKFSIGQYGHIALVTDTEGNMIGLHSVV